LLHFAVVCTKLRRKLDIKAREINDIGMTVFSYACANTNNPDILNMILNRAPDISVVDATERTPLHHAARKQIPAVEYDAILINVALV
jgi:ankyrin repeat protein